ncbi:hypothetical protein BofuT4_P118790.1 [Botrytis cinerea T4]|uniref:Uncharacterized protein n=1 Tax=Botryotinia fuckeliana (strain T4) TaxID=999810 RepID=G2Y114_BOTF4|nr:hypothetical protein BofuT4_P118790.1 [Botrytis cinerea T4]
MSRYWPHPPYASDQPHSAPILWIHILTRGPPTAAFLTPFISGSALMYRKLPLPSSLLPRSQPLSFPSQLLNLRSMGTNTLGVTFLFTLATIARMYGRTEIEYQDRSWRLLENKGQMESDDWMYGGMIVGALWKFKPGYLVDWRVRIGSISAGSAIGVLGYLGWRYGVKGGKWDEDERNERTENSNL